MKNIIYLFLAFAVFSCVSKKKYDELAVKKSKLEVAKSNSDKKNKMLSADIQELNKFLEERDLTIEELANDTTQLANLYKELIDSYRNLSKISAADAQNLSKQLQKVANLRAELEQRDSVLIQDQKEIEVLKKDLETRELTVDSLINSLNDREKRVQELEQLIADRDNAIKSLKDKITNALLSFNDEDLTVEVRDGKVYISLAEQLLFLSGSYNLDSKGKDALSKVGDVLRNQTGVDIVVEGHTDDLAMPPRGDIKDNWDLSVLRATAIVRELTKSGVDATMVAASGRGEFKPKVAEKTKEARKINRRSEIIISPDLSDLFNIIDEQAPTTIEE